MLLVNDDKQSNQIAENRLKSICFQNTGILILQSTPFLSIFSGSSEADYLNNLLIMKTGKGEGGSNDFFSIYLFFIWSIYSFVRAMNNTLSRFLKSGSAVDSFTQRSDHSHMTLKMLIYIFNNCKWYLLSISPSFGLVFDARCYINVVLQ